MVKAKGNRSFQNTFLETKANEFNEAVRSSRMFASRYSCFQSGFYERAFVDWLGIPLCTYTRWFGERLTERRVLLPAYRCKEIDAPVDPEETPIVFKYVNAGPSSYRYSPLFDRTEQVEGHTIHDYEVFDENYGKD